MLTRPAVEAGENLGFPGDLQEKVGPLFKTGYMMSYELLGLNLSINYLEKGVIEGTLAYMRGRILR